MTLTWKEFSQSKILSPDKISSKVEELRKNHLTIATINGSFDLLHAGHLHILFEASQAADKLIVALNSDSSIQSYKSPLRPIIPQQMRLEMVAALQCVSYVTWFEETTPIEILSKIKPDVHVNGAEYGPDCIEAETIKANGGEIKIVELVKGLSTSEIIDTILERN